MMSMNAVSFHFKRSKVLQIESFFKNFDKIIYCEGRDEILVENDQNSYSQKIIFEIEKKRLFPKELGPKMER
jgi:hypothetical protein